MTLSDNELIKNYLEGDSLAFEDLVYRHDKLVLLTALKYCGNEDDAKDIYQDVFIRVMKGLKNFNYKSEFSTWLYRITVNVCLTHNAKMKKKREEYITTINDESEEINLEETLIADVEETSPQAKIENLDISEKVGEAINYLSPKERICFILKHYSGYKIREISEMMNCKEGTVKKYLFDSVRKLRKKLNFYDFA